MKNIDIFVAAHKPCKIQIKDFSYKMIQVGAIGKEHFSQLTDDMYEDNISSKNYTYCELTAMYHIWKHSNADIKGLCHYRRYFTSHQYLSEALSYTIKKYPFILSGKKIEKILNNHDLIVGIHPHKNQSDFDYYKEHHIISDLNCVKSVIGELYPDYISAFNECLNSDNFYLANMLYAPKEIFDAYSRWLFDILFEVEKQIDLAGRDDYQKRALGFLSERLLKVWVMKNNLNPYIGYIIRIL